MKERNEAEERKEVNEVKEHARNIAAFFDLDGTLVGLPSLERRFFRMLKYRRALPARNYCLWLREAMRLVPSGINAILQANKMYLRGVQSFDECGEGDGGAIHDCLSPPLLRKRSREWHGTRSGGTCSCW